MATFGEAPAGDAARGAKIFKTKYAASYWVGYGGRRLVKG